MLSFHQRGEAGRRRRRRATRRRFPGDVEGLVGAVAERGVEQLRQHEEVRVRLGLEGDVALGRVLRVAESAEGE